MLPRRQKSAARHHTSAAVSPTSRYSRHAASFTADASKSSTSEPRQHSSAPSSIITAPPPFPAGPPPPAPPSAGRPRHHLEQLPGALHHDRQQVQCTAPPQYPGHIVSISSPLLTNCRRRPIGSPGSPLLSLAAYHRSPDTAVSICSPPPTGHCCPIGTPSLTGHCRLHWLTIAHRPPPSVRSHSPPSVAGPRRIASFTRSLGHVIFITCTCRNSLWFDVY